MKEFIMRTGRIGMYGITAVIIVTLALAFAACDDVTKMTKSNLTGTVKLSNYLPKAGDTITATYHPGNGSGAETWQWFRADGDDVLIPDANAGVYVATAADVGSKIKVKVSFSDQSGSLSEVTTEAVAAASDNPGDITYTIAQTGGTDNVTDSTGITFTFSASVDSYNLTATDITVSGAAAKDPTATLTGTGATRTLGITVNAAGSATVSIAKTGIGAGTRHVTVYKAGQAAPTLTSITATYNGAAVIYPSTPLDDLKDHLTVRATYSDSKVDTLSPNEYNLSGSLAVGTSSITVSYEGKTTTFDVTVTAALITPLHSHQWGAWAATDPAIEGTEERVCATDGSHIEHRLTGTGRFAFTAIGSPATAYSVKKGTVTSGAVIVPAFYRPDSDSEYLSVTALGAVGDAFAAGAFVSTTIASISIPESVTIIGGNAFRNNSVLTSITIPAAVTAIGADAFNNTSNLTTVTIAEGSQLVSIGNTAFNSTKITSITIPASVTTIGTGVFGLATLTTVTFEAGSQLEAISNTTFQGAGITSIEIPASVTSIGTSAFQGSNASTPGNLTTVTFAANSQLTTIGNYAFRYRANVTSIEIPTSVNTIGEMAFGDWTAAQTIYIKKYADETAATSGYGATWLSGCNAVRKYWNGSSYQ
jgi:hypothetical protein